MYLVNPPNVFMPQDCQTCLPHLQLTGSQAQSQPAPSLLPSCLCASLKDFFLHTHKPIHLWVCFQVQIKNKPSHIHCNLPLDYIYYYQRWEVTKYKYFFTVTKSIFQVSVLYLSIYFPVNFLLLRPTLEHKYLYFLLLPFWKLLLDQRRFVYYTL